MSPLPRLLVATPCEETFAALRRLLAGEVEMLVAPDPQRALQLIDEDAGSLAGLLADTRLPSRMARVLAEAYLRRSARGVAVLLASLDDPDTLMRLDISSGRLEVIFRPWNDWELRTCLLGSPLEATGTG